MHSVNRLELGVALRLFLTFENTSLLIHQRRLAVFPRCTCLLVVGIVFMLDFVAKSLEAAP